LEKINTLISQWKKHRDNNEEEKALEIFKQAELLKQNYEDM
jgi:hypothetical protein